HGLFSFQTPLTGAARTRTAPQSLFIIVGRLRHSPTLTFTCFESAHIMSLFSPVEMAPRDPILGLNEAFNADPRTEKVNLGVGVYYDENGKVPLLRAVQAAEEARVAEHAARTYLPMEGLAPYDLAVQKLLLGADSALLA